MALTAIDPRYVGAWWVGHLISIGLFVLVAVPFSCFGAEMPSKFKVVIMLIYCVDAYLMLKQTCAMNALIIGISLWHIFPTKFLLGYYSVSK